MNTPSLDDILSEDDEFGLLEHRMRNCPFSHISTHPKPEDRAEADFVAQRQAPEGKGLCAL
jgi:hypothetical protein